MKKNTAAAVETAMTARISKRKIVLCGLGGLCVFLFATSTTLLSAQSGVATIRDIRRTQLDDGVRVTIELDREVAFHDERIEGPVRVFVDLATSRPSSALADQTLRFGDEGGLVHQIRIGRHPNSTTRVVLDAVDVSSYSVYPLYSPFRVVIDCIRGAAPARAAPLLPPPPAPAALRTVAPPPLPTRLVTSLAPIRRAPSLTPRRSVQIADARASIPAPVTIPSAVLADSPPPVDPPPSVTSVSPMETPSRNRTGGYSMSRQLGLGVSRIVIDPGHGGHDPGAKGKGVSEAEVVLDIALRLEKLLQRVPGVDVILTRRTDEFIALQERTAIANREGADLFLSIHANASPNAQARGVETYFLNFANNLSAAQVAARENAASGQAMGALPDLVKTIALNNKLDESRDLAAQVQRMMLERLRSSNTAIKDLGVKQAPFVVLIGAAMPSVLAEISFVTNAQDAKLLKGTPYRQHIAEALFNGIRRYQSSLRNTTAVAGQ